MRRSNRDHSDMHVPYCVAAAMPRDRGGYGGYGATFARSLYSSSSSRSFSSA